MKQLRDERLRKRIDGLALRIAQVREKTTMPLELAEAHRFPAGVQRGE